MTAHLRHNHPTAIVLPEPINVSPLIRFARWSFLGLGVVWGLYRYSKICEYHADLREYYFEKKLAAAREKQVKKKWLAKDEMRVLLKVNFFFNLIVHFILIKIYV